MGRSLDIGPRQVTKVWIKCRQRCCQLLSQQHEYMMDGLVLQTCSPRPANVLEIVVAPCLIPQEVGEMMVLSFFSVGGLHKRLRPGTSYLVGQSSTHHVFSDADPPFSLSCSYRKHSRTDSTRRSNVVVQFVVRRHG